MTLHRTLIVILIFLTASCASAEPRPEIDLSYEQATDIWQSNKERKDFQTYLDAFTEWNNHFQLDTRNDCYAKGSEPVTILLVITDRAVIEPVFSNIGGAKAECFRLSYLGLKVAEPPFSPLVIQLNMQ
jgi:hypothetical protein